MPRKSTGTYPPDWKDLAREVKDRANWTCIRCGHPHDPKAGRTLTVHHLDINPSNRAWWNLLALCQACHLSIQGRVYLERPWVMAEHTAWFKPYVGGWYAHRYLARDVTREEVEANLEWFVGIECRELLGRGEGRG